MSTYVFAKNGMGDYTTGAGMREDMLMQAFNIFNYQAGIVLSGDLVVTERAAGANMSVDVAKGRCFVLNSSYVANTANSTKYWGMLSDAVTNLAISTNTSGSTRYDLIIAKIDTGASPNDYATNVGTIEVVEGVAGSGQPATPSNSLLLAVLEIPTGTTTQILDSNITDSRVSTEQDWTPYTPTWTASSSNPAIGNGTLEGSYCILPHLIIGRVALTAGTTTTFGSGEFYFSLPELAIEPGTIANFEPIGDAQIKDSSASPPNNGYPGYTYLYDNSKVIIEFLFLNGSYVVSSVAAASAPINFTTGDQINFNFMYRY